jgi:hypothetical protein
MRLLNKRGASNMHSSNNSSSINVMQHITRDGNDGATFTLALDVTLRTAGDGYWSKVAKDVRVVEVAMGFDCYEGEVSWGDLGIYYDEATWNDATDGLIYTDTAFLAGLKAALIAAGCDAEAVEGIDYSEQGMQDDGRVSCDAEAFGEWLAKHLQEG